MKLEERELRSWIETSSSRYDLWTAFLDATGARTVAEIGVYRGEFAVRLLGGCSGISTYYMIDPWRRLDDWNKPANKADDIFERFYREAMEKTSAYEHKRIVLRGKTSEVVDEIPDDSLDFAYVDGDHTLRGITIDLIRTFPKVRDGGCIGGDDFRPSIWQHDRKYEPTLVFPFAVHFAEAVGARIFALPFNQFLIQKARHGGYSFVDFSGKYDSVELKRQLESTPADEPKTRSFRERLLRLAGR